MNLGGSSIPGPRPYNEDAYLLRDLSQHKRQLGGLLAFLLVSDGMGGHQSGDVASRTAVDAAADYLDELIRMAEENSLDVDIELALREIITEAHEAVIAAAEERGATSMGATMVAAFVSRNRIWVGHVGDSRAYILREGDGVQVTVDHSQVGRMIAEGILTEEQAQHHPQRNVIERALGFDGFEVETSASELRSGDAVLLCSDGLSTALSGVDMAAIAAASSNAERAAGRMTSEAERAGTDDNTTAVLWAYDWNGFRRAAPRSNRGGRHRVARGRHGRAQRTSMLVFGTLGALALAIGAYAVLGSGGNGGSGTVAQPKTQSSGPTTTAAEPSTVQTSTSSEVTPVAGSRLAQPRVVVVKDLDDDEVWLRLEPSVDEGKLLAVVLPDTRLSLTWISRDSRFFGLPLKEVPEEAMSKRSEAFETVAGNPVVWLFKDSVKDATVDQAGGARNQ